MIDLEKPRIENGHLMLVAGLLERYTHDTVQGIPSQWQPFAPYIGNVPGEIPGPKVNEPK